MIAGDTDGRLGGVGVQLCQQRLFVLTPSLQRERLSSLERHCFGMVCSYLSLEELVMLQTVARALQPKALDVNSWRSGRTWEQASRRLSARVSSPAC